MNNDVISSAAKVSPPIGVVVTYLSGIHVSDVVMIFTLIYTTLQIYVLLRDKVFKT